MAPSPASFGLVPMPRLVAAGEGQMPAVGADATCRPLRYKRISRPSTVNATCCHSSSGNGSFCPSRRKRRGGSHLADRPRDRPRWPSGRRRIGRVSCGPSSWRCWPKPAGSSRRPKPRRSVGRSSSGDSWARWRNRRGAARQTTTPRRADRAHNAARGCPSRAA